MKILNWHNPIALKSYQKIKLEVPYCNYTIYTMADWVRPHMDLHWNTSTNLNNLINFVLNLGRNNKIHYQIISLKFLFSRVRERFLWRITIIKYFTRSLNSKTLRDECKFLSLQQLWCWIRDHLESHLFLPKELLTHKIMILDQINLFPTMISIYWRGRVKSLKCSWTTQ